MEIALVPESPIVEPPYCVGREAELDLVRGQLHDAALGDGFAVVWVGEPGIGKSRFLRECAAIKVAALTLSARCGATRTFGPDVAGQLAAALRVSGAGSQRPHAAAVLAAIAERTKRRPVAIFIDDLDRAGAGELDFIEALVAMARRHRLVVVACASEWRHSGAAVRRLNALDEPAMELLVRGIAGLRGFSGEEVREILKTAQGNPRFGVELATAARQGNGDATSVPASARAVVAGLRTSVSAADFEIVSACAVIGDRFCSDWLEAITLRPREELADALQRASDLGVVLDDPGAPRWLAFRQAAVRKALYASIVALKRRILHERVVQRMGDEANRGDPRIDELLAHHAEMVDDRECAADAYRRAADALHDAAAFSAAGDLYVRAARHLTTGETAWIERMRRAIRCYRLVGDWLGVQAVVHPLLDALDLERDASIAGSELENLFFAQLNDGDQESAERTAERIASLGLPDSVNRGRVATLILSYGLCYTGRLAEAARLLATAPPQDGDDDEVRMRYCIARAEIGALVTPLDRTAAIIEAGAESARRLSVRGQAACYGAGAELASRYGDLATAREFVERAQEVARKSAGEINDVWRRILKERTRIAMLEGDLPAARDLVRANIGWRESGRHNEAFDAGAAVAVGMRVGDLSLVDAFFEPQLLDDSAGARDAESCGSLLSGFAEVMQIRGMGRELRGVLDRCIAERLIDPYTAIQLCAARYAPMDCAQRAVEQAEEYFNGAVAPAAAAHVKLCKATLLRRQGRHLAAAELAGKAASRFGEIGWRAYEAVALELAGNLRRASRLYAQCGATSDVARLGAGETRKLKYAPFGARLSPREREVARLVAAKRSNRDIARALEISVRTVDHHVEAAFSKLGVRARWELTPEMLDSRSRA